ncbi:IS6 family transposase [Labrys miyagiensis]|uniref:IS6 family transposase n=1 Tax=Labrys miyagiensis TaxID=346912 RepID=A0ABQ6CLU4_9HYPH|nr:IS6 family transposase [Labrys miyagiensis]GLS20602.1 IS6 family transposase [Labrys miyagiensis]
MFKGRHFDQSVILLCVRWYLAYGLSLRDLKEMMAERGISIDHSTIHRWVVHFSPMLLEHFNRRKRAVGKRRHMDETYIKVRGQSIYLYRAIDSVGDTVEFWFSEHRDPPAAKCFLRKALVRHGRPDRIVIDGSQTNREAIISCCVENRLRDRSQRPLKPIRIRESQYLNNRIEQDHRRTKRRVRPMLGFKAMSSATATLAGVEVIYMMRKRQGRFPFNHARSLKEQFEEIAA